MQWHERLGRRLKLRDLHTFQTVAQCRSMAKAAAYLAVSQPAISKAIADMEHTLGVRLLDRTSRGVEPTAYGQALLRSGVAVFDDLRRGIKEIEFLADPLAGELRIGCTEPMASGFVSAVIDRLLQQHPRLALLVTQGDPIVLQNVHLRERKFELAVGRIQSFSEAAEDMETEILFSEPAVVVVGLQSKWTRKRKIELADLFGERWALPFAESAAGSQFKSAFRASGLDYPPPNTVTTSAMQLTISLVETGRYIGILPGSLLRFCSKRFSLKALPIELSLQPRPVGIVTLKDRTISPVAKLFVECAREIARPMTKRN
jgi:DNA-binding transcriptional LysR family regulator